MKGINIRGAARWARQKVRSVAWAAVFLASMNARAEEAQPPVAVAARLFDEGDSARLTFDLSGPVEALARPITDPDQIIVDFPEVNFQIDPSVGRIAAPRSRRPGEGVSLRAVRSGQVAGGDRTGASGLSHQGHDQADREGVRAIAPDRRAQALRCRKFSSLPPGRQIRRPRPRRPRPQRVRPRSGRR